jgi:hypothetical protein
MIVGEEVDFNCIGPSRTKPEGVREQAFRNGKGTIEDQRHIDDEYFLHFLLVKTDQTDVKVTQPEGLLDTKMMMA